MSAKIYKASQIADWFLAFSEAKSQSPIDKMKLQKLLYFSQSHHLADFGQEIFEEEFEAWVRGPVVSEIYHSASYQSEVNPSNQEEGSYLISLTNDFDFADFDMETNEFLVSIWNTYSPFTGRELSLMTHDELPWKWHFVDEEETHSRVIPKQVMQNYYLLGRVAVNV